MRTNTKDGLPVTSPRGLLDRLNLRQILAQRFVFSIRPGKAFHLSASPKNIAAASLGPQIMPLWWRRGRSLIGPLNVNTSEHLHLHPDISHLTNIKHQNLFWWRLKYNMIGPRGSPHGPICLFVCSTYFWSFDVFVLSSVRAFLLGVSHNTLTPQCQPILI